MCVLGDIIEGFLRDPVYGDTDKLTDILKLSINVLIQPNIGMLKTPILHQFA
jgi:hypothetical protein